MAGPTPHRRIAVVGSGVAGLTAAYVAARSAQVTVFEADGRLGGHADTHQVDGLAIDTGFIVHNQRTYPTLLRLFRELGISTQQSEMSMSVRDDTSGLEYAGALGLRGLFPTVRNLGRPAYLRMLTEIPRFHRRARRLLAHPLDFETGRAAPRTLGSTPTLLNLLARRSSFASSGRASSDATLRDFLADGGFSAYFARHFTESLVAAVWSCDPEVALDYPARYLFEFLHHHGMLRVFGSPQWRTVTGGSHEYVAAVAATLDDVRTGTKVTSVLETPGGVEVTDGNGATSTYDAVVIATHPDQALAMLAAPTTAQRDVLDALPYSRNTALLHTDTSILPKAAGARASWNFHRPRTELARSETQAGRLRRLGSDPSSLGADRDVSKPAAGGLVVTYDLTRLQRLPTSRQYLLTLGGEDLVDPGAVIERREYDHPLYSPESVAAQRRLPEVNTSRVAFAGAYHGWGFHEDGARSGVAAAAHLGFQWGSPVVEVRGALRGSQARTSGTTPATSLETTRRVLTGFTRPSCETHRVSRLLARSSLGAPQPPTPTIYDTTIRHTRRTPFTRTFTHRSHTWLVDLDDLPDHGVLSPVLGSFEPRDHLGEPQLTIRENVQRFLAAQGVRSPVGRVLMAANARAFGYCFNPISVFWCFTPAGEQAAVVVEVHNTYGDRHAYLVHPDDRGVATTPKQMYVSPFHATDGTYTLAAPVPSDRLHVSVALHTEEGRPFAASMSGTRSGAGPLRAAPAALRGALLIRAHGIWLWLRRLPIHPRPTHHQEGVSSR